MMYKERSSKPAMIKYLAIVPVLAILLVVFSSHISFSGNNFDKEKVKEEINHFFGTNQLHTEGVMTFVEQLNEKYPNQRSGISDVFDELSPLKGYTIDLSKTNQDLKLCVGYSDKNIKKNSNEKSWKKIANQIKNITSIYLSDNGSIMVNSENLDNKSLKSVLSKIPPTYIDNKRILLISAEPLVKSERIAEIAAIGEELGFLVQLDNYPNWKDLSKEPLLVVDGVIKGRGESIVQGINPNEIASMTVLKDEVAIKKYGEEGRNGVIEIKMNKLHSYVHGDDNEVLKVSSDMPRFPGCEDIEGTADEKEDCAKQKMLEFIYKNLKYPSEARDKGIDGMVVIQMVIDKEGNVKDANIVRDVAGGCGQEALRVVNIFPQWIPGRQDGKLVNVQYTLPVRYKLEDDEKAQSEKTDKVDTPTMISDQDEIFRVVEEMPRFPGCEDIKDAEERENCARQKMLTHIYTNVKYPKEARDGEIEGVSVVEFIVMKDGAIKDAKILRNPGGGCGEESLRVVATMPDFIPGRQRGKAVNVRYVIPVKYKLQGDKEKNLTNDLDIKGPILSPNPNDGRFTVSFKTQSESTVNIKVFGESGALIQEVESKPIGNTVNKQIDISGLATKVGFVTVMQEGKVYTEKVIHN